MQITLKERHQQAAKRLPSVRHLIGERLLDVAPGGRWTHVDPSTGQPQAEIPLATPAELDQAVAAARKAFPSWRDMAPRKRQDILYRLADLLEQHREELGILTTLENGAAHMTADIMTDAGADWVRYYAGWADKLVGDVSSHRSENTFIYTVSEPIGVIGAIITWNGPVMSMGMKIGPALAAGNTVVYKPAELTPFTALRFAELAMEAGLPPGVLNIVHGGNDVGAALTSHSGIDKISFTGGPDTARRILASAAAMLRPSILELGGKSANLIFADADLAQAIPISVATCMINAGQGCSLPTRMLVEESIYDKVVEQAAAVAAQLQLGDPLLPDTSVGPVINQAALDRILGVIDRAKASGAGRLIAGGGRVESEEHRGGYFIAPTVFADVDPASELAQKEVFGPVLTITKFRSEAEGIALANNTQYGLAAYIHGKDHARNTRVAYQLYAGSVCINGSVAPIHHAPFGGVGISGFGREGGREGIEEMTYRKSVLVNLGQAHVGAG